MTKETVTPSINQKYHKRKEEADAGAGITYLDLLATAEHSEEPDRGRIEWNSQNCNLTDKELRDLKARMKREQRL